MQHAWILFLCYDTSNMQAIILAAGKGSRLAPLTDTIPKGLIEVAGMPILKRLMRNLPDQITEIIFVIDYLGDKIKDYFTEEYDGKKIIYVEQGNMTGTYGALFSAKKYIKSGSFLVLSSDDICSKEELTRATQNKLAFGIHKRIMPGKEWLVVDCSNNLVKGLRKPNEEEFQLPQNMATGVYVLDERFWKYKPFQLLNGEYGLPQTMRDMFEEEEVSCAQMPDWMQINTHEQLAYTREYFGKDHI